MPSRSPPQRRPKQAAPRSTTTRKRLGAKIPLLLATGLVAIVLLLANRVPMPYGTLPARQGPALNTAQSWGYQLQKVSAKKIPDMIDLLVVDYSKDGSQAKAFTVQDVARLRQRKDGSRRIVLAYMSIGEAERYRHYWQPIWGVTKPRWLGKENDDWPGNYAVRYWHKGWQKLIVTPARSGFDAMSDQLLPGRKPYIDRILEAGFDGVYLDRVDAYGDWGQVRKTAQQDMILFVARLSAYAKTRKPGFLIVPQNGEELLRSASYRTVIDGVAKEDLYYGIYDEEEPNPSRDVTRSERHLRRLHKAGYPVFIVEYLDDREKRKRARKLAKRRGYVIQFANRSLDQPPLSQWHQRRRRKFATMPK